MRKIQRRHLFVTAGLLSVILLCSFPCQVFPGVGEIVFDPTVWKQTVMNYVKEVETAINTARQVQNQLESLQNEARNIAAMDQTAAASTMSRIQSSLYQLTQMRSTMQGITMDYSKLQAAWDGVYKNFAAYNGMSGRDYANQAQKIMEQSNKSAYDAMKAQGLVAQLGDDVSNLNRLLTASNTAPGALAAAQAGNQIAGMTVQQLMRLEEIVATSYRAQSSYYAAQAQKEAMANANLKRQLDLDPPKASPLSGAGNTRSRSKF
ncbi:MAG: hypothetical protein A4E63_00513 [Syntrophorhabdus sp. PtaU1.Bin050]|jgi:P-type conjugative transfer protein TrbJ|nr:MAG: hypothetical protein A4E63_00513 [Syntrophorhabdus sp. PtaU1.Bin050]